MKLTDMPAYQSKFLKPEDLKGSEVPAVISGVEFIEGTKFQSTEKEQSAYLKFEGKNKMLKLNKTNAAVLTMAFGDVENFTGKKVILRPTLVNGKPTVAVSAIQDVDVESISL